MHFALDNGFMKYYIFICIIFIILYNLNIIYYIFDKFLKYSNFIGIQITYVLIMYLNIEHIL